jgi:DNA-binding beta-propeller fold protein YncE
MQTHRSQFVLAWGRRGDRDGEFDVPIDVAVSPSGEVFVTDFYNRRVQRFSPEGEFLGAFPTADSPSGLAVGHEGLVYVAEFEEGRIAVYTAAGERIRRWGSTGSGDGQFQQPGGIVISPEGRVYVADQVNRRVQVFDAEGRFLAKWGEYGLGPGQFGGNMPPASRVAGPQFLAIDSRANVYTTEASVGRVQKFTPEGEFLAAWGNNGTGPGGFGGHPELPGPIGICITPRDLIWISATNNRVHQFTLEGRFMAGFGSPGAGPGEFGVPHGLTIDSSGHLYVVDLQNCRIQKFRSGAR